MGGEDQRPRRGADYLPDGVRVEVWRSCGFWHVAHGKVARGVGRTLDVAFDHFIMAMTRAAAPETPKESTRG